MSFFYVVLLEIFSLTVFSQAHNLSCYQCKRYTNEPCEEENLLPCSAQFDRCVTHISRDDTKGYMIKRECGLGPCGFEDDMASKGLGWGSCDRSKDEYFCISCCRTSGCNKNSTSTTLPHRKFLFGILILLEPKSEQRQA